VFIVGGNGSIGTNLRRVDKENFFSSSSYSKEPIENGIKFNLTCDSCEDFVKNNFGLLKDGVVFLSAYSDPDFCYRQRKDSDLLNFEKACELIEVLDRHEIYFIFASTEFVFDGEGGNYSETATANPILWYGKQKKKVEDFICGNNYFGSILRLPKVYWEADNGETLLTKAISDLHSKKKLLKLASNQIMTPLFGGDLMVVFRMLNNRKPTGIYHCGGPFELSRFDFYSSTKKFLISKGEDITVVLEECSIHDFNSLERRPENTSLNSSKITDILGRKNRSHLEVLEEFYDA
jgi:dTDP-4-dehydrorhamnose reductase